MGYCMNPSCDGGLFDDGTYVGEIAHIVPHGAGGGDEFENLINLCPNCHTRTDAGRNDRTVDILRAWKNERRQDLEARFSNRFTRFSQLEGYVVPLLLRNRDLHKGYGPVESASSDDGRYRMWVSVEAEILINNQKILLAMERNRELLHRENQDIIVQFRGHVKEFIATRRQRIKRIRLFPEELNSLFGVEEMRTQPAPNVGALENLITRLMRERRFIDLELEPEQILTYSKSGKTRELRLADRPRVQQVYWSNRLYVPAGTPLPLATLVFLLEWLTRNNIPYRFPDVRNLTHIVVGETQEVHLGYEYMFSLADLHGVRVVENLIVLNLHHWNGGPFTPDAAAYARRIGVRLLNQNEFFVLAHRELSGT